LLAFANILAWTSTWFVEDITRKTSRMGLAAEILAMPWINLALGQAIGQVFDKKVHVHDLVF